VRQVHEASRQLEADVFPQGVGAEQKSGTTLERFAVVHLGHLRLDIWSLCLVLHATSVLLYISICLSAAFQQHRNFASWATILPFVAVLFLPLSRILLTFLSFFL